MSARGPVLVVPEGRMEWSIQLPVQAQSRVMAAPWERSAGPDEIVAAARKADEVGCFAVGACDHVAIPRDHAEFMSTTWYDPIALLGMVAGVTRRVRLMTHVYVLAYRHPLVAAKAFATLDRVSGGRVIAGVGVGHVEEEFAALGADYERRGARLDESIDVLAAALTEEFPVVTTPSFDVHDLGASPRPVQVPRPPIWIGGSSRAALRRAAQRGDGWLPQGTPVDEMPPLIAELRAARERLRPGEAIDITSMAGPFYVGEPPWDVGPKTFAGKPAEIAERLTPLRELGVNHLMIGFRSRSCDELLDQMESFGTEVAPLLNV